MPDLLVLEKPQLQLKLRELVLNTIKACEITDKIITHQGQSIPNQNPLLTTCKKNEKRSAEMRLVLTELAGDANACGRYSRREIVLGNVIISNMESIMNALLQISENKVAAYNAENSKATAEISLLTTHILTILKSLLKKLSSALRRKVSIPKINMAFNLELKIQNVLGIVLETRDNKNLHEMLEIIYAVESLDRSIIQCAKCLTSLQSVGYSKRGNGEQTR
ncbi:hypothetical protein MNBD_NITROSPINAE01-1883 [hydrothermal vent metagenome]|uniref:PhoU domain-containing protein n=1 Tax=hydrothermal vent metagenome TaxID=652676 RepID=A0A3B1C9P0_9ZZZZ